jgi:hypothetical protein
VPELLLMLLAFTRLLILSTTSLDIDDVNFVLLCWSQLLFQHEEEEHKENDDDEFFENDDDETKNEELLLEIVLKGRDLKEEERAETPLNIYISFRLRCFCVWSWSSVCTKNAHQTNEEIFRVFIKKKTKEKIFEKTSQSRLKETDATKNYLMVAASPVLTTSALARMLEERPDPSAFQPVLQIAGIAFLFTFLFNYYKHAALLLFLSLLLRKNQFSLRERDRIFE